MNRKRLGELLVEAGLIDGLQLESALGHQRQWGGRLGRIVVQMGFVPEHRMLAVLAAKLGVPVADPPPDDLHPRVIAEIPADFAARWLVFPLGLRREARGDALVVAMSDPTNVEALDALRFLTGKAIHVALAGDTALEGWIRRFYFGDRRADPAQVATIQQAQQALADVQFGGQTVEFEDDIPLVTGAIVSSPTPPPQPAPLGAPAAPPPSPSPSPVMADPFAAFGPTSTSPADPFAAFGAPPTAPPPSADPFAAAQLAPIEVPGARTETGLRGIAELAPLSPRPEAEWDARVPTTAPASTAAPVFAPAGSFLGEPDDDVAAPVPPPTTVTAPPPPAAAAPPVEVPPPPAPAMSMPPAPAPEVPSFDAPAPTPPPPPPALVAPPSPLAGPSWADFLEDSLPPPPATTPPVAAMPTAEPPPPGAAMPTTEAVPPVAAMPAAPALPSVPATPTSTPTLLAPSAACPRCAAPRVEAARFCPFCGMSFVAPAAAPPPDLRTTRVDVALADVAAPAERPEPTRIDVALADVGAPAERPEPTRFDMALADVAPAVAVEPPGPVVAPPADAPPADAGVAAPVDAAPVEAVDAPADAVALGIDLAPVDASPVEATPADAMALGFDLAPVDADVAAPVDDAPADADVVVDVDVAFEAADAPSAVDDSVEAAGASSSNALAAQWADAAERPMPRQETDTRNALGWVPPSREVLTVREPAAPAPEPILTYAPAAVAVAAAAPVAPWARFAPPPAPTPPAMSTGPDGIDVEPPAPVAPVNDMAPVADGANDTAALANDTGEIPTADTGEFDAVDVALGSEAKAPAGATAGVPSDVDPVASDIVALAPAPDVGGDAPVGDVVAPTADAPAPESAAVALVSDAHPTAIDVDVDVAQADLAQTDVASVHPPSSDLATAPAVAPPGDGLPDAAPALEASEAFAFGAGATLEDLETIDVSDLDDAPPAPALPTAPAPAPSPLAVPPSPWQVAVGGPVGPLADEAPWPLPPSDSAALHDDPFAPMPAPAMTLPTPATPPTESWSVGPVGVVAGFDVVGGSAPGGVPPSAPAEPPALPAWQPQPDAPAPPPMKLTPTMVMKLDPAEQRRLLAVLIERANVGPDVLSSPPAPATDDDPSKR
jgi:hypothetical protein